MENMYIRASSFLSEQGFFLNKELKHVFIEKNWLKEGYKFARLDYPRFYKMDELSQMTILAAEQLKTTGCWKHLSDSGVDLLFANAHASNQTDSKFIESYEKKGNPSPSLFVYTLPNVAMGELARYYKWHGEQAFFIAPEFGTKNPFAERLYQLAQKNKKEILCMWVDTTASLKSHCFAFLVDLNGNETKSINKIKLTEEMNILYAYYISKSE